MGYKPAIYNHISLSHAPWYHEYVHQVKITKFVALCHHNYHFIIHISFIQSLINSIWIAVGLQCVCHIQWPNMLQRGVTKCCGTYLVIYCTKYMLLYIHRYSCNHFCWRYSAVNSLMTPSKGCNKLIVFTKCWAMSMMNHHLLCLKKAHVYAIILIKIKYFFCSNYINPVIFNKNGSQ